MLRTYVGGFMVLSLIAALPIAACAAETSIRLVDRGLYRVEVSSPFGRISSDPVTLTVINPPAISLMP